MKNRVYFCHRGLVISVEHREVKFRESHLFILFSFVFVLCRASVKVYAYRNHLVTFN